MPGLGGAGRAALGEPKWPVMKVPGSQGGCEKMGDPLKKESLHLAGKKNDPLGGSSSGSRQPAWEVLVGRRF